MFNKCALCLNYEQTEIQRQGRFACCGKGCKTLVADGQRLQNFLIQAS